MAPGSIERPTLIERFVQIIPLPYTYAALVWAVILPSGPGYSLAAGSIGMFLSNLTNGILNFLLPLYLFLIVRYVRLRVVAAEEPISARLSGGTEEYQRVFGRMAQTTPVLVLAVPFGTLILVSYAFGGILSSAPSLLIPNIIVVYVAAITFSNYIWEFATVSVGIHRLGGSSLRLGSFLEDRMMGAKPLGNLALSLTLAYFVGLLLSVLLFSTFIPFNFASQWPFILFLLLGVALFFLPLNSVHARMQAEKRRLLREVGARYPRLDSEPSQHSENATLEDVHTRLTQLTQMQEVEMLERKVASLPTWPFDIQVVSKFITIVLSVTAVLLSRIITGFLHI